MATKKYVWNQTIRENINSFRALMGQYFFIDSLGSLQYGQNKVVLPEPSSTPDPPRDGESRYGPTVDVYYKPNVPYAAERRLTFQRAEPKGLGSTDYETEWLRGGYASPELGMVKNKETGGTDLHMRVQATSDDYLTLGTFIADLDTIFQNNLIDGVEVGWGDWSFRSTNYSSDDPLVTAKSSYNFFSENYETAIATVPESSIPNAYAVAAVATFDSKTAPEGSGPGKTGPGTGSEYHTTPTGEDAPEVVRGSFDEDIFTHVSLYDKINIDREVFGLPAKDAFDDGVLVPNTAAYINYVNEWGNQYSNLSSDESSGLELLGKNVLMTYGFQANNTSHMNDNILPSDLLTERKVNMPFYVEINAPADVPTGIYSLGSEEDVGFFAVGREEVDDDYGPYTKLVDMIGDLTTVWTSHIATAMDPAVSLTPSESDLYGFQVGDYYITNNGFSELSDTNLLSLDASRILDFSLDHTYKIGYSYEPETRSATNSIAALAYNAINGGLNFETGDVASPKNTFNLSRKLILDGRSVEKGYALTLGQEDSIPDALELDGDLKRKLADQFITTHYNHDYFPPDMYLSPVDQSVSMESILAWTNDAYDGARSYTQAFEHDIGATSCFTQTICYGIDKYRGDKETGEYVQTIWIPNNSSELNYVDSQVRYGQKYTYDVHAYKYVFGMDYKYEQVVAPKEKSVVERVGGEGGTLGYIIRWDGAKNLFDKIDGVWVWALVASAANTSPVARGNYDLFEDLYPGGDSSADGLSGGGAGGYKSFGVRNEHYFSIGDLNDLFEKAWYTKPTGPDGTEYESWDEIWSDYTWGEDGLEITDETVVGGGVRTNFVRETYTLLGTLNPTTFSINEWFKLFFGAGDNAEFVLETKVVLGAFDPDTGDLLRTEVNKTQQGYPPSHHLLFSDGDFFGDQDGIFTGFEQPLSWRGWGPADAEWRNTHVSRGTYTFDGDEVVTDAIDPPYQIVGLSLLEVGETFIEESDGFEAEYKIVMKPATRIVKVPYFTRSSIVLSNPPPAPEVEIIPYRGINDNLLFTFDATFTKQSAIPIAIEPGEEDLINGYYDAQGLLPGEKIVFESDDIPDSFQVYRLDSLPSSYSDFAGNQRASISTLVSSEGKTIRVASATYVENLQPNTKYYYTFRTADFHGNVSNPTIVYEIELVDDGGAIYPIIKTHQFSAVESTTNSIPMKKLIEITPSLSQVTANVSQNVLNSDGETIPTPNTGDLSSVRLGDESLIDPIWDKTFKIRLTSRQTGKKMDFNVTFKTKDERIE